MDTAYISNVFYLFRHINSSQIILLIFKLIPLKGLFIKVLQVMDLLESTEVSPFVSFSYSLQQNQNVFIYFILVL